jgi:diadenosine tetraphosphate (Ap4A) HIT family hydrolase
MNNMKDESWTLWSNNKFEVFTPFNPHIPPEEGVHIIIVPTTNVETAWTDENLCAETFKVAAKVAQTMETLNLAPWFNLQANGNWGLLPGSSPWFHVHVYGRRKGTTWAQPVQIPLSPGTYSNKPMTKSERDELSGALMVRL